MTGSNLSLGSDFIYVKWLPFSFPWHEGLNVQPMTTFLRPFFWVATIALIAGCYDTTLDAGKLTMTCSPWVAQTIIGLSIGAFIVGFVLRKRSIAVPITCTCIGLFGFLVLLPVAQLDNVVIDDNHYERNGGVTYFHRVHDEIIFANVSRIEIIQVKERRAKGRVQVNYYFVVTEKGSKESRQLPIGDMAKLLIPEIIERAREHKVEFVNSSDLEN